MIRCFMRFFTGGGHWITGNHWWFTETEQRLLVSHGFYVQSYQDWSAKDLVHEFRDVIVELEALAHTHGIKDPWHYVPHALRSLEWECQTHPDGFFHIAKDFSVQPIRCPVMHPKTAIQRGGPCD